MDIKYNIYYSTDINGPWTLANPASIDHTEDVMTTTISGVALNVNCYFIIAGGVEEDGEFVPLLSQSIGPVAMGSRSVGDAGKIYLTKPWMPYVRAIATLGHQFEVV